MQTGRMPTGAAVRDIDGVLLDLLTGVMNSLRVWTDSARDPERGLAWRDAVTARMRASVTYAPYEQLITDATLDAGLPAEASAELLDRWAAMEPWPDAANLTRLTVPYAFVTNCSTALARSAAQRSGLTPRFTLAAQEAGWFKPDVRIYREACRRLGTTVERTLFVAGSPYDAVGAGAAGLPTWLVLRRSDQRAPGAPIAVARSLTEVMDAINRS